LADEFWNDWQPDLIQYAIPPAASVPTSSSTQVQNSSTVLKSSSTAGPATAPVTTTTTTAGPKARAEVVGMISAYTNAIQSKRKRDEPATSTESFDEEACAQEQKRIRLEVFDPMMDAFNSGDFAQMTKLVHNSCHDEVRLKFPNSSSSYQGVTSILIFWGLLHETYPDAMTKILEKRISSSTSASCPIQSAEYVYKFHGTRITSKPVMESFAQIMEAVNNKHDMTHEEIVSAIARQMTSIPPQSYEEHECSFIAETILTFDSENKITEWAYDVLASDVR
jgi:hypothetical protein